MHIKETLIKIKLQSALKTIKNRNKSKIRYLVYPIQIILTLNSKDKDMEVKEEWELF